MSEQQRVSAARAGTGVRGAKPPGKGTRTIMVDHLARIEGHAGITVTLDEDRVERVQFDVFEGIRLFEGLVKNRPVIEIAGIVSRICAICSHGHAITALLALEQALGIDASAQTKRLRELAFHGAAIESHALHVFCLALPDFLRRPSVIDLAADAPETVALALRLKRLGNTIQEVVGGRAVHPVNYAIGGFGRLPGHDELLRLQADLTGGLDDCARAVEALAGVTVPAFADAPVRCAALVPDNGSYFFGDRISLDGGTIPVDDYRTLTNERAVPHSTARHSMADGRPYMVGALPRLTLNGAAITGGARDAWSVLGPAVPSGNVVTNSIAQAVELAFSVEQALVIVDRLLTEGLTPEPRRQYDPRPGRGTAAAEVPRGVLFHSYEIGTDGRIAAADVITPTAQNCAHLEEQIRAAVGAMANAPDDELQRALEIIVRAYDPCVSCSVHVIRTRRT
jgi:sulfhydrogenase subunit alpha